MSVHSSSLSEASRFRGTASRCSARSSVIDDAEEEAPSAGRAVSRPARQAPWIPSSRVVRECPRTGLSVAGRKTKGCLATDDGAQTSRQPRPAASREASQEDGRVSVLAGRCRGAEAGQALGSSCRDCAAVKRAQPSVCLSMTAVRAPKRGKMR
ncbi:hypothetical protein VTO42DRAFT_4073 [Malbranchea cinnamomea]